MLMIAPKTVDAITSMTAMMPSGCVDDLRQPTNICSPSEYFPNLKTRKIRTSRTTRRKPRLGTPLSSSSCEASSISVALSQLPCLS